VSAIALPPIRRERLPSGLNVLVAARRGVPLAAVRLLVRAGSALDPAARFGLAHLVASAVRRGTRTRTGARIDAEVEALGAELGAGVDEDAASVGLSAPVEALPKLLDVVADVATAPAFPAREVERLRRREVAGLAHDLDEPGIVADRATLMAAYADHPYGHPSEGRGRHLAATRRGDLAEFHALHWRPSRATLVIVGPVEPEATLALVRRRFGRWRGEPGGDLEIAPPAPLGGPAVVVVDQPELSQAQLRVAATGYARSSPDHAAGLVAGAVLGGGFTSRLMEAIRVNRGLSYGVRARFASGRAGGLFFVSSFTKVETAGALVGVALDELARFREAGPTEEELSRTRAYLGGLYPLALETHEGWAEKLSEMELYGLPPDEVSGFRARIEAVDAAACLDVARRFLPGDRRVVVAVGPAKALEPQLAAFGPVKVVPARTVM
jgi:zinc protease